MGATLAKIKDVEFELPDSAILHHHNIEIHVFSDSADIKGNAGIQQEVFDSIKGVYALDCTVHKYPTMHFREHYQDIRDAIFKIKQEYNPEIVYCKSPNSLHPDHQVIGEACESIFLECTVYAMFGIRDGHNQHINKWVRVSKEELDTKIEALMCYTSQKKRAYHDTEFLIGQAKMRGAQIGVPYAEAFEVIREIS